MNQKDIESCPQKNEIFKTIRTWENARAANAFPRKIKKLLARPDKNWTLEAGNTDDDWILYELLEGEKVNSYYLTRATGY
jgi:hypothetical protein